MKDIEFRVKHYNLLENCEFSISPIVVVAAEYDCIVLVVSVEYVVISVRFGWWNQDKNFLENHWIRIHGAYDMQEIVQRELHRWWHWRCPRVESRRVVPVVDGRSWSCYCPDSTSMWSMCNDHPKLAYWDMRRSHTCRRCFYDAEKSTNSLSHHFPRNRDTSKFLMMLTLGQVPAPGTSIVALT